MVTRLFQLLLLISPIAESANINMDMFDIVFFRTGAIVLFTASLIDKPKRVMPDYLNKIIFGLLGLCIVNLFITTFNPMVLHETMNTFLGVVALYIVYTYWDDKQDLTRFILWAGVINLLFYIGQRAGFDPVWDIKVYPGQDGAFLGNQPRLMTYFALITPFMPLFGLAVSVALGLLTKQYIIFIPVVLVLFARLKTSRERVLFGIMTMLAMVAVWGHIVQTLSYRLNIAWKPALTALFDRPLLGFGLGVMPQVMREGYFNSYLPLIMGFGILGAVWFGYVFYTMRDKFLFNKYALPLLSLLLIMFIEYPLEIMRLRFTIIAIIMIALIKGMKEVSNA